MEIKGLHDILTAQSLISHSIPATRAERVAQLGRMELEEARLERELDVWVGKKKKTEARLQQVRQHIERLKRALDRDSGGRQTVDDEQVDDEQKAKSKGWRGILLEY